MHSYKRKTNGVKRERVLRSLLVLNAQIYRCVRFYKMSRNEACNSSLSCAFGWFFLSFERFFFESPTQKKETNSRKV